MAFYQVFKNLYLYTKIRIRTLDCLDTYKECQGFISPGLEALSSDYILPHGGRNRWTIWALSSSGWGGGKRPQNPG
jgi:hypothetical protein